MKEKDGSEKGGEKSPVQVRTCIARFQPDSNRDELLRLFLDRKILQVYVDLNLVPETSLIACLTELRTLFSAVPAISEPIIVGSVRTRLDGQVLEFLSHNLIGTIGLSFEEYCREMEENDEFVQRMRAQMV